MPKPLVLFLFTFLLTILSGRAAAQDSCYHHDVATVSVITRMRENYGWSSRIISGARPGDTYEIIGSQQLDDGCWVQTTVGWLHGDTLSADAADTPAAATPQDAGISAPAATPTATALPGCYSDPIAYVTGTMNIRRSPSADVERVGQAQEGDIYAVSASTQGDSYCWLQIEDGWMAQTGRIRGTVPAAALPRIEGDAAFIEQIQSGLDYLKEEALEWYLYVIAPSYTIRPSPPGEAITYMYPALRRMDVLEEHLTPLINLASTMAHEVCHLYQ